jgi:hypothetical protein
MQDLGHENYSYYCIIILCYWLMTSDAILRHVRRKVYQEKKA